MLYPKDTALRQVKSLDGFWSFAADKDNIGIENAWYNGLQPDDIREIAVPASWNEQFNDLFNFHGKGWYEKNIIIPKEHSEKALYLRFGNVAGKATVWVNGSEVATHVGTALPFECEVSSYINFGNTNKIVVLADSTLDPWSLPPAALGANEGRVGFFNSYPAVTYDFFPYGGLQRSVYLYTTSKTRIEDITIRTTVENNSATVNFDIKLNKCFNGDISITTNGTTIALPINSDFSSGSITVENPRLWDIGKPELYDLTVTLSKGGIDVDTYTETYGIRTVKIENGKFLLNGNEVFFKGFGKHEDFFILGKGFSPAVTVKDFYLLKWIGANSFRTSHYPYDENIMDYADRHGILVIDETPFVGLNTRMYRDDILVKAKSVIKELFERDKNHPCVVMWSLANEPNIETKEGENFFAEMAKTARALDGTRPITYVAHLEPENNLGYENYDVVCINKYYGWYIAPGQMYETLGDFEACIERFYNKFKKPMIISEFGTDAIEGMHCDPPQMFSEEYQSETVRCQYEMMRKKDYVIGAHVWCFADFKAAQTTSRIILNRKGVFTRDRQPKMVAHTLKKLWSEK